MRERERGGQSSSSSSGSVCLGPLAQRSGNLKGMGSRGDGYDVPHRACEWAMHLKRWDEVIAREGWPASAVVWEVGRLCGRVLSLDEMASLAWAPVGAICTWHQWLRLLKEALEACLFVIF